MDRPFLGRREMIKEAIGRLIQGRDLTEEEAYLAMVDVVEGRATPPQIASFATAARMKGVSVREVLGAVKAVRERLPRIRARDDLVVMDREEINLDEETMLRTFLGNGKRTRTFTISTATAFVVAGAGVKVAKSGNPGPSDLLGGEQVLRALGIELQISTTLVERCIEEMGVGFLYTPMFQGPWRPTLEVRRQMGFRTLFNLMGPLCNPYGAQRLFLGVYEPESMTLLGEVLKALGIQGAVIVHGEDSLDEVSITGKTLICQVDPAGLAFHEILPEDVGLRRGKVEEIAGGNAADNARIIRGILSGDDGARRDVVVLSSALALLAAGRAKDVPDGLTMAREAMESGEALRRLEGVIRLTNEKGYARAL
jgi:anthranilate phosphoribosyltransferase